MLRPRLKEEGHFRELVLGVEQDQFGSWLFRLEEMRDHAGPFVRTRRTAIGGRRRGHHHHAAVLHGAELVSEQPGLEARLPCMGHGLGGVLIIALKRAPANIDARRQDGPIPGQGRAVFQDNVLGTDIHIAGGGMDHVNAFGRQG